VPPSDLAGVRRGVAGRLGAHHCRIVAVLVVRRLAGRHLDGGRLRGFRWVHRDRSRSFVLWRSSGQNDRHQAATEILTNARRCLVTHATQVVLWRRRRVSVSLVADPSDVPQGLYLEHPGRRCERHLDCRFGWGERAGPAVADVRSQMGVGRTA
jgi:hypothetical protein